MKAVTIGRWTISQGKGARYYMSCNDIGKDPGVGVMHPDQLAEMNGCGVYGFQELKDLAGAIRKFETIAALEDGERQLYKRLKEKYEANNEQ